MGLEDELQPYENGGKVTVQYMGLGESRLDSKVEGTKLFGI